MMDAPLSVGVTLEQALKEFHASNYRGMVELLLPLLRAKLSPQQERDVVGLLSTAYRRLEDFVAARAALGGFGATALRSAFT